MSSDKVAQQSISQLSASGAYVDTVISDDYLMLWGGQELCLA